MKLLDRRFLNISLAVRAIANEPAANPSVGTQYIVGAAATGAFAGVLANSIARYNGSDWEFSFPKQGELEVLNLENGQILAFNGSAWASVASLGSSSILPVHGIVDFFYENGANNDTLPGQFGICWNNSAYSFCSSTFEFNSAAKNLVIASPSISNGQRFAAALNGKIFTFPDAQSKDSIVEESLSDGDLVFNIADNSFYAYSATAHRLLKLATNILSVDELLDYSVKQLANPDENGLSVGNYVLDWQSCSIYSISKTENFSTSDSISGEHDILIGQSFIARDDANFHSPIFIQVLAETNSEIGKAFRHGTEGELSYVRISVISDGAIIINKADNSTYVFDALSASFLKLTASSQSFTEVHSLSAAEAEAKSFSLTYPVAAGQENNIICSVSGVVQIPSIDFSVSGLVLSWYEKGLDSVDLEEGDTFIIHYIKE